ncbi:MAG TPA: hypothetical protein VNO33_22940, partial [Kofleriaceae bacterium]|nr:hypothetical protein [Kofleriaceae bacterium]
MSRPLAAVLPLLLWTVSHGCGGSSPADRQTGVEGPDAQASTASPDRVALAIDTGQAEAVLAIAGAGDAPEEAWRRLFDSEGHRLLEAREASMQRSFSQADFRSFALSAALAARAPALRSTLAGWNAVDLTATARRVLPYLPAEARIAATVFPVIK